ncbi:MAG: hypothetical protein KAU17_01080 [Spirochaetales bacterium]|nr:hypothetical protein [Spirochaetales bacterium]
MELDFYKLHFSRNDIILVNFYHRTGPGEELRREIARKMCRRHRGVGGNGLIFIFSGEEHAVRMDYYLPDGRDANLLGDAILCTGRFAFDSGMVNKDRFVVETINGPKGVDCIDSNNFRISLGIPETLSGTPLQEEVSEVFTQLVEVEGKNYPITPVRVGRAGGVLLFRDEPVEGLKFLSRKIEKSNFFGVQLLPVFGKVFSREELLVNTWFREQGVDFSSAGSIATVAAIVNGFCDREVLLHIQGKDSFLQWVEPTNEIFLTGSAEYVFSGTYYFDEQSDGDISDYFIDR